MATNNKNLREGRSIVFADGKSRTIYPLSIRQLRKFMKTIKEMPDTVDTASLEDKDIDLMIEAAAIVLEKVDLELSLDLEAIEDVIDIKIFNELIGAAMGADPNV